jgi:hypothetical protein
MTNSEDKPPPAVGAYWIKEEDYPALRRLFVNAFAVAADPAPGFSVSKTTTVVMDDSTTVAQLGTVGAPNVVGSPARSLWQTDAAAIKITFDCDWAMRSATGVSWVTGITW